MRSLQLSHYKAPFTQSSENYNKSPYSVWFADLVRHCNLELFPSRLNSDFMLQRPLCKAFNMR